MPMNADRPFLLAAFDSTGHGAGGWMRLSDLCRRSWWRGSIFLCFCVTKGRLTANNEV
jgi:hypothetical protein